MPTTKSRLDRIATDLSSTSPADIAAALADIRRLYPEGPISEADADRLLSGFVGRPQERRIPLRHVGPQLFRKGYEYTQAVIHAWADPITHDEALNSRYSWGFAWDVLEHLRSGLLMETWEVSPNTVKLEPSGRPEPAPASPQSSDFERVVESSVKLLDLAASGQNTLAVVIDVLAALLRVEPGPAASASLRRLTAAAQRVAPPLAGAVPAIDDLDVALGLAGAVAVAAAKAGRPLHDAARLAELADHAGLLEAELRALWFGQLIRDRGHNVRREARIFHMWQAADRTARSMMH